jgi:hypothetical protein
MSNVRARMSERKFSVGRALEGAGYALEAAVRFGLVSGAAVAAFFGQVVLAVVLAAIAVGMFLRLWRGKVSK